jgi:hypothetical protein
MPVLPKIVVGMSPAFMDSLCPSPPPHLLDLFRVSLRCLVRPGLPPCEQAKKACPTLEGFQREALG